MYTALRTFAEAAAVIHVEQLEPKLLSAAERSAQMVHHGQPRPRPWQQKHGNEQRSQRQAVMVPLRQNAHGKRLPQECNGPAMVTMGPAKLNTLCCTPEWRNTRTKSADVAAAHHLSPTAKTSASSPSGSCEVHSLL